MTPEKLKEIEAKAQELYPLGKADYLDSTKILGRAIMVCSQEAYTAGALSRQPELDTLQSENDRLRERVRELEEGLKEAIILISYLDENSKIHEGETEHYGNLYMNTTGLIDQLLTKPDSTGGGENGSDNYPIICHHCGMGFHSSLETQGHRCVLRIGE